MADNIQRESSGSGKTVATDDIASVHYQKIKIVLGLDSTIDGDIDSGSQAMANSIPIVLPFDQVVRVQGPAIHDGIALRDAIQIGGQAENTRPVGVADLDAVRAWIDTVGRLVVDIGVPDTSYFAGEYTAFYDGPLLWCQGSCTYITLYDLVMSTQTDGTILLY